MSWHFEELTRKKIAKLEAYLDALKKAGPRTMTGFVDELDGTRKKIIQVPLENPLTIPITKP